MLYPGCGTCACYTRGVVPVPAIPGFGRMGPVITRVWENVARYTSVLWENMPVLSREWDPLSARFEQRMGHLSARFAPKEALIPYGPQDPLLARVPEVL